MNREKIRLFKNTCDNCKRTLDIWFDLHFSKSKANHLTYGLSITSSWRSGLAEVSIIISQNSLYSSSFMTELNSNYSNSNFNFFQIRFYRIFREILSYFWVLCAFLRVRKELSNNRFKMFMHNTNTKIYKINTHTQDTPIHTHIYKERERETDRHIHTYSGPILQAKKMKIRSV